MKFCALWDGWEEDAEGNLRFVSGVVGVDGKRYRYSYAMQKKIKDKVLETLPEILGADNADDAGDLKF